jgi:hypothetical protein
MTKDAGIIIAIPPDLKDWVDAQAEDIGVNAAIWIRMLVFAARKGRAAPVSLQALVAPPSHHGVPVRVVEELPPSGDGAADPDAWRGPVDDEAGDAQASGVDVDAMVANRLAEVDAAGPVERMAPVEVFGPPQQADIIYGGFGGVRSLRRPAPAYSPANQPRHLHGIMCVFSESFAINFDSERCWRGTKGRSNSNRKAINMLTVKLLSALASQWYAFVLEKEAINANTCHCDACCVCGVPGCCSKEACRAGGDC